MYCSMGQGADDALSSMRNSWDDMASLELWLPFQTFSDKCQTFQCVLESDLTTHFKYIRLSRQAHANTVPEGFGVFPFLFAFICM